MEGPKFEPTNFQKEFKVNDEFYSAKEIRKNILKYYATGKDDDYLRGKDNRAQSLHISGPDDSRSFIEPSELETLIPDTQKEIDYTNSEKEVHIEEMLSQRIFKRYRDLFSVYALTTFEPTDLGYICIKHVQERL